MKASIFIALREGFGILELVLLEPPGKEGFKVLQGRLSSVFWVPCGNRGISLLDLRLIVEVFQADESRFFTDCLKTCSCIDSGLFPITRTIRPRLESFDLSKRSSGCKAQVRHLQDVAVGNVVVAGRASQLAWVFVRCKVDEPVSLWDSQGNNGMSRR